MHDTTLVANQDIHIHDFAPLNTHTLNKKARYPLNSSVNLSLCSGMDFQRNPPNCSS